MATAGMDDRPREISVSRLLLDQANARLGKLQADQKSTELALAKHLGSQLLEIATDIVANGLDPSASLIVTIEGVPSGRYLVLEGNRRTLAVRALTRPEIVKSVLTPSRFKRLVELSKKFHENPITKVRCVIFATAREADHWVEIRHTGANKGVGLVEWDSNEKDRWKSRRGGPAKRSVAGQVLDFVEKFHPPAPGDNTRIVSTLQRIIGITSSQKRLGIAVESGVVHSHYPPLEVLKGLAKIVTDLRSGEIKVMDVYTAELRDGYVNRLPAEALPDPETRLVNPIVLSEISPEEPGSADAHDGDSQESSGAQEGGIGGAPSAAPAKSENDSEESTPNTSSTEEIPDSTVTKNAAGARRSRVKLPVPRASTIPNNCYLWIPQARIKSIYHELLELNVNEFTNSCAVLLRVFVELSVDHHIDSHSIMTEAERRNSPLAKRMKELAKFLRVNGRISEQMEKAINKIADGVGMFSASTTTFNQYVHNPFAYPQASELRVAWDELEPFMQTLWVK
ncbi:hypothetical protein [Actinomadura nitritigenes]|uniref:hypothetical protein n=1 Tax=Actinomadura nitritigenes TaxID=134602 RepID=UPI003D89BA09